MNLDEDLQRANDYLKKGLVEQAVEILHPILAEEGRKAIAAYSLGVSYALNTEYKNLELAKHYYAIAESEGHRMAGYKIAGILHREGDLKEAFLAYKTIYTVNPSAAYWCYRLAKENKFEDYRLYLKAAVDSGHVLAIRDDILEQIKGRDGLGAVFRALARIFPFLRHAKAAVSNETESLYR